MFEMALPTPPSAEVELMMSEPPEAFTLTMMEVAIPVPAEFEGLIDNIVLPSVAGVPESTHELLSARPFGSPVWVQEVGAVPPVKVGESVLIATFCTRYTVLDEPEIVVECHVWLPETKKGEFCWTFVAPLPNCPLLSVPQHFMEASSRMAQVWYSPLATATAVRLTPGLLMRVGEFWFDVPPLPNCPLKPTPQQDVAPLSRMAQV
jgi:hypothetical protein